MGALRFFAFFLTILLVYTVNAGNTSINLLDFPPVIENKGFIVLTSTEALCNKYNYSECTEIKEKINYLIQVLQQEGYEVLFLDVGTEDETETKELIEEGITNFKNESIVKADVSIFIIGDHDVIPYYKAKNPFYEFSDGFSEDEYVFTDNYYSDLDGDMFTSELSIGRIPDGAESRVLLNYLDITYSYHLYSLTNNQTLSGYYKKHYDSEKYCGVVYSLLDTWYATEKNIEDIMNDKSYRVFHSDTPPVELVPYYWTTTYEPWESADDFRYFELHGGLYSKSWYGEGPLYEGDETIFYEAFSPSYSEAAEFAYMPIMISNACYGGFTYGKDSSESIILSFFEKDFVNVFPSFQASNYAGVNEPMYSDRLMANYLTELFGGEESGKAMINAKNKQLDSEEEFEPLNKKEILIFEHYGDPTYRLVKNSCNVYPAYMAMYYLYQGSEGEE